MSTGSSRWEQPCSSYAGMCVWGRGCGVLPAPEVVLNTEHVWGPVSAPGSSKAAVGLFSLCILGPECAPTAHARSYEFSAFCCSRRGVSRCMRGSTAVKGPRSQAPLNRRSPSGPCVSRLLPQWKGERSIMQADQEDLLWDRVCSPVSPRKETVCPRGR